MSDYGDDYDDFPENDIDLTYNAFNEDEGELEDAFYNKETEEKEVKEGKEFDEGEDNIDSFDVDQIEQAGLNTKKAATVKEIIRGDRRRSNNILSKFEYARLCGTIATLIDYPGFVIDPRLYNLTSSRSSLNLAEKWVDHRMEILVPLKIYRPYSNHVEEWYPEELISYKDTWKYNGGYN
jgi:hypothetical protein